MMYSEVQFSGYNIISCQFNELLYRARENSSAGKGISVYFLPAHGFVEANNSAELKDILSRGIIVSDGRPLTFYLRLKDKRFSQLRGPSFMRESLMHENSSSSHFFIGGSQDLLDRLVLQARKMNPKIKITGAYSPPFTEDWREIVQLCTPQIEKEKPQFIWIGLGAPKQFYVSNALAETLPGAYFSVGAAFDFIAETKKECPELISRVGFEWLFRLASEPKRLFWRYTIVNFQFVGIIFSDFLHDLLRSNRE
jgi:N-acetylglucosaminyldiphosphoundecaprenol N-acetyl-beta-D-mannosaminyltransferase